MTIESIADLPDAEARCARLGYTVEEFRAHEAAIAADEAWLEAEVAAGRIAPTTLGDYYKDDEPVAVVVERVNIDHP